MSESVYSPMQMNTGFDDSIIDQLLDTAEENKEKEEDELEIERKYYQKPDPATDPLQAGNFLRTFVQGMMQKMGEFDTDYKLFYRPILDFGSGVGINESMEKYNLEEMNRRNQEEIQMDNIGMSDNENLDFLQDFLIAKGYNKLIPEGLRDKYKREADIEKYLKNMDKFRQRGILS